MFAIPRIAGAREARGILSYGRPYPWLNALAGVAALPVMTRSRWVMGEGVTPLAALNVAMGAATITGDPLNPIAPTCALGSTECANPLRLGGIPISWGSRWQLQY